MIDPLQLRLAADRILERPLAPAPPLHSVWRRAAARRRRRIVGRSVSGAAVVCVAVVASLQLVDRDSEVRVRVVPPAESPRTERDGEQPAPKSRPTDRYDAPTPVLPSGSVASGGRDVRREEATAETAAWEGCRVYSRPGGSGPVISPGDAGETVPECSFTATRSGGYEGGGTWTLDIVRDGERITFDSVRSASCADGVIRPGDEVTAHLGLRAADGTYTNASAGGGEWHLTVGSGIGCA